MSPPRFKVGSKVVFAKDKMGLSPGPRAKEVVPLEKGDAYSYIVDKFWTVKAMHADGTATLITRRGKEHMVRVDDPRLRPATLWERLWYRRRFPPVPMAPGQSAAL